MTDHVNRHAPTPEFRASLERDVVDTFRRESRFAPASVPARPRRWRTVLPLAAGLVLGVGVQFAAGQVQDAQQRTALVATLTQQLELERVKLQLAQSSYDLTKRRFDVGAASRPALLASEANVREQEAAVQQIGLDIAETRATAAEPRHDLAAPLVGGRDFVKERLTLEAYIWQERVKALSAAVGDAQRSADVGATAASAVDEARSALADAQAELDLRAYKLTLRREFFERKLEPRELARLVQRFDLASRVRRLTDKLRLAQARSRRVQRDSAAGTVGEMQEKRAELDVLELQLELARLDQQIKSLGGPRPD